jgi:hypothetical protein
LSCARDRPRNLNAAGVPYGDWSGTAAADGDMVTGTDLHTITGLDNDAWLIVAIEIDASATGPDTVLVYAIDSRRYGYSDYIGVKALEESEGSLPVTSISSTASASGTSSTA